MKAKTYLRRIAYIDTALRINREELERLKIKAESIGGTASDGDRVQSSKVIGDSTAEMVAEYVDIQGTLINESLALEAERQGIINTIKMLIPEECDVLYLRYVNDKSFQEISCEMDRALSTINGIHSRAIQHLQRTSLSSLLLMYHLGSHYHHHLSSLFFQNQRNL